MDQKMFKALFCCANSTCSKNFSVWLTESNSYQEYQSELAKMNRVIYRNGCWGCKKAQEDPQQKCICPKIKQHWKEVLKILMAPRNQGIQRYMKKR